MSRGARLRPVDMGNLLQPALQGLGLEAAASARFGQSLGNAGQAIGDGIARGKARREDARRDARDFGESQRRYDQQAGFEERRLGLAEGESAARNSERLDAVAAADSNLTAVKWMMEQFRGMQSMGAKPEPGWWDKVTGHIRAIGGAVSAGQLSVLQEDGGGVLPSSVEGDFDSLNNELANVEARLSVARNMKSMAVASMRGLSGPRLAEANRALMEAELVVGGLSALHTRTKNNLEYVKARSTVEANRRQAAADAQAKAAETDRANLGALSAYLNTSDAQLIPEADRMAYRKAVDSGQMRPGDALKGLGDIRTNIEQDRTFKAGQDQREVTNTRLAEGLELRKQAATRAAEGFKRNEERYQAGVASKNQDRIEDAQADNRRLVQDAWRDVQSGWEKVYVSDEDRLRDVRAAMSVVPPRVASDYLWHAGVDPKSMLGVALAERAGAVAPSVGAGPAPGREVAAPAGAREAAAANAARELSALPHEQQTPEAWAAIKRKHGL